MTHEIRLTIAFTPRIVWFLLMIILVTAVPLELDSETLTMTTTYPSPSGIYNTMVTTGNTTLARTGGSQVSMVQNGGNVGIGSGTNTATLNVVGTINATTINATGTITGATVLGCVYQ